MSILAEAFALVFTPYTLTVIVAAAFFGLFVGAIPGLTATMATALLVPFSFYMDPIPAIAAIVACTTMAITAGDIPGCTHAHSRYARHRRLCRRSLRDDPQGRPGARHLHRLLGIGGLIGTALLFTAAPAGQVALKFSSFEYFWLECSACPAPCSSRRAGSGARSRC